MIRSAIIPITKNITTPDTIFLTEALDPKLAIPIATAPSITKGATYAVIPKSPKRIELTALPKSPHIPKLHKKRKIVRAITRITTSSLLRE